MPLTQTSIVYPEWLKMAASTSASLIAEECSLTVLTETVVKLVVQGMGAEAGSLELDAADGES